MFTKILIANRGEIACRVMQTTVRWSAAWDARDVVVAGLTRWREPAWGISKGMAAGVEALLGAGWKRSLQGNEK